MSKGVSVKISENRPWAHRIFLAVVTSSPRSAQPQLASRLRRDGYTTLNERTARVNDDEAESNENAFVKMGAASNIRASRPDCMFEA
ncbi:hypothetical protein BDN70DRAFT_932732 [Pholiota conissans]|uniref:Uncharacterized protein n=1 Tax=Pholiota conissans TaxID=109636 RepID=A0A9P5Z0M1_9AGAR|nr:hypothetical protein BDN70DRAFT_932732 [Pholiota conissans]